MIDDGYRASTPKKLFYTVLAVDFTDFASTIADPSVVGVTQYLILNPDNSVDVVLYTGTVPVPPATSTLIRAVNGIGLTNLNALGDLVIFSGLVNQNVGDPVPANLINSKYFISANAPIGSFTLTPLSVNDMLVGDVVQVVNYVDMSVSPIAPVNLVIILDAISRLFQTIHWRTTTDASLRVFRRIRVSHVAQACDSCGCGKGSSCRCRDYSGIKNTVRYMLDSPVEHYIRSSTDISSATSKLWLENGVGTSIVDLLREGNAQKIRAETLGLKYNRQTRQIERGVRTDYLDMSQRDVEKYLRAHERRSRASVNAINEVGGLASFSTGE